MHILLTKLLNKRGIKDVAELDDRPIIEGVLSEKGQFEKWNETLLGGEDVFSVDRLKSFCISQKKVIEGQWKNLDNDTRKNDRLITMHTVYSILLEAIDSPKVEREKLERELENLTK